MIRSLVGCLGVAELCTAMPATAYTGDSLAKFAEVSFERARQIALKAHPGVISDRELETETGDSAMRYSFDIRAGSVTQEVGVDARTGRVPENKPERTHPD